MRRSLYTSHNITHGEAGVVKGPITTPAGPQGGRAVQLYRLGPETDKYAEQPIVQLVVISYETSTAIWAGSFDVIATARFASGKVTQQMEVDVPAGGCAFAVPGSDGLEITVRAEGTSVGASAMVRGAIAYQSAGNSRPAQRTMEVWTLPADSGVLRRLPSFTRRLTPLSTVRPFPVTSIDVTRSPVVGAGDTLARFTGAEGVSLTVPVGADSVRVVSGAAHSVRLVCELWP